jgi:hypothetical protein
MTYINDINVGDVIYTVEEVYNWASGKQKRFTMIDDEGNEWHRYDKPSVEYYVVTWLVKGKITNKFEGDLPDKEEISDYSDSLVVENVKTKEKNTLSAICGSLLENVYLDIGDAEAAKDELFKKSY